MSSTKQRIEAVEAWLTDLKVKRPIKLTVYPQKKQK
jgi:hypothetical protein